MIYSSFAENHGFQAVNECLVFLLPPSPPIIGRYGGQVGRIEAMLFRDSTDHKIRGASILRMFQYRY